MLRRKKDNTKPTQNKEKIGKIGKLLNPRSLAERGDGFSDGKRLLIVKDRWSAVVGAHHPGTP